MPPVTILIAGYNEAGGIDETRQAIYRLRYDALVQVIVIDDGATEDTALALERMN